jgi:hypothetical protein
VHSPLRPDAGAMGMSTSAHREACTEVCHIDSSVATQTMRPCVRFQALLLGCRYAQGPSRSGEESLCRKFDPRAFLLPQSAA